tara:strand:+ start:198 stop:440 length:243 start_codon:yes stop_codon:yes gene_type:complete
MRNKKGTLKPHRATERATQRQIGGKHYKDFKIQPIEFITKNKLSFIQGNIIKYVCRFGEKNGNEDIDKAIHYCELLKEIK